MFAHIGKALRHLLVSAHVEPWESILLFGPRTRSSAKSGNFKDVRFHPTLNFGLFWAAL